MPVQAEIQESIPRFIELLRLLDLFSQQHTGYAHVIQYSQGSYTSMSGLGFSSGIAFGIFIYTLNIRDSQGPFGQQTVGASA